LICYDLGAVVAAGGVATPGDIAVGEEHCATIDRIAVAIDGDIDGADGGAFGVVEQYPIQIRFAAVGGVCYQIDVTIDVQTTGPDHDVNTRIMCAREHRRECRLGCTTR